MLHVVVIGVVGGLEVDGGLNIGVQNGVKKIEIQRSNLGSYWTFLVLTAFQTEDERHWPAFRGLPSPLNTNTREP